MPKFMSQNAFDSLNQRSGNQPVIIVAINWGLGVSFYSTKTFDVDNYSVKGSVLQIGNISNQKRNDNFGNCSNVSLTLDDSDGEFKFISDNTLIEKKPIAVYLHFLGNSSADYILLFYGKISGPVEWSEGQRQLTISATSDLESSELGVSPTKDDFKDLSPEAEGIPWPLVFGTVKHVPAVEIRKHSEAILASSIRLKGLIYQIVENNTATRQQVRNILKSSDKCDVVSINTNELNKFYFEGSDNINFPTDKDIKLSVDGVIFRGKYDSDSNTFQVKASNIPQYENIKIGARDSNDSVEKDRTSKSGDPESGYNILWLEDAKININQKHCYFQTSTNKDWYNFCEAQYGMKCVFKYPFRSPTSGKLFLMTSSNIISQVYAIEKSGTENGVADKILQQGDQTSNLTALTSLLDRIKISDSGFWIRPSGTKIRLWDAEDPDVYLVSAVELDSVQTVYAKKKVPLENGKELEVFSEIPNYYYEIQLQSNFTIQGDFASGIIFYTPLSERDDGKWDNQIYVSCVSSIGPNTADILKYLLSRFSDYGIKSSSFSGVAGLIDDTPSNFALIERGDTLKICQEIAWQARCGLVIEEQIINLKYLGEAQSSVMELNETNIELKSIDLGWTETVDLATKLVASWTPDYRNVEAPTKQRESRKSEVTEIVRALLEDARKITSASRYTIYKNNIRQFGVIPKDVKIYIYNQEQYVLKTLKFWGFRYSNIWRKVSLKTMLPGLFLREFDTINLNFPLTSLISSINGIVESTIFNPITLELTLEIWIPSIAGTFAPSEFAYVGK